MKEATDINRRILPLHDGELLVETIRGFYMIVPNWNLDVAIGIVRDGVIEPWTNEVFLTMFGPGDTVVNVGANFGYYSLLAGHRVGTAGKVFAIEANPYVFRFLVKGVFWSGVPGIVHPFLCAAASPDMDGKIIKFGCDPQFIGGGNMFNRADTVNNLESGHWSGLNMHKVINSERMFVPAGILTEVEAEGRTLDRILRNEKSIKALLIDAEGSESFVISGAQDVIRRSPDLEIIVEWDPTTSALVESRIPMIKFMWKFLIEEQGFTPFRIRHEGHRGIGHMPELTQLDMESLYSIPHSDIYLKRDAHPVLVN
jgi:FkbM family methyltransferase